MAALFQNPKEQTAPAVGHPAPRLPVVHPAPMPSPDPSAPSPRGGGRGSPEGRGEGTNGDPNDRANPASLSAPEPLTSSPPHLFTSSTPLSPQEEALFAAIARHGGNPIELAESLNLPYSQLLRWINEPRIRTLLEQHDELVARCDATRARQAQARLAGRLTDDFDHAEDPKERRRLATPLLRANRPVPRPATRARAARAPAADALPSPSRRITVSPSHPPDDHIPEPLRAPFARMSRAHHAFAHSPPTITLADFEREMTAYAHALEHHHASSLAPPRHDDAPADTPTPSPIDPKPRTGNPTSSEPRPP